MADSNSAYYKNQRNAIHCILIMMDEKGQLCNAVRRRAASNRNTTVRLGDAVRQLMEGRISPRQSRFESVAEFWSHLLPGELRRHCELAGISGGQLNVVVDSPPYMHELQLCSSQLLREIQKRRPQARIKKIRFLIGQVTPCEP